MKHSFKISILMVIAIISNSNLFATVRTWNGSASTAWATTSNWSGNTVPASSDTVVIPVSLTNYPSITASSVTVRRIVLGGNLNVNSNRSLTVTGSMVINSGTFTASGNFSVVNLTMNAGNLTTGSSCAFNVSGYLLLNDGTINLNTVNSYSIANADFNGGTFTAHGANANSFGSGSLVVDGSQIIIASNTGTMNTSASGTFEFISGTINMNNQTLEIRGKYTYTGGTYLNVGTLSVSVYNFDYNGTFVLNYRLRISDTLNFINGKIQSSEFNKISFANNAYANGANDNKHIIGPVCFAVSSNNTTASFTFPIGDGTYYAPLTLSNFGTRNTGDSFTAMYYRTTNSNANGTLGTGLSIISKNEYWLLNRTSSNTSILTTANVTLSYNSVRSGTIADAILLKVARWNGTQWLDLGRASGSSTNNSNGTLSTAARISDFGFFTIGSSSIINPLPVKLLNFNAEAVASNVNVKWTTTSEINNDYFNVEKSLDGKNWSVIGTVKGAGNTEALTNYNFVDANPVMGMQYYRLQQNDINGEFTYSSIAPVNFTNAVTSQISIFPMPANNFINVELPGVSEMSVAIYNSNGQKVFEATSGNLQTIDIQDFNAGLYIIEVNSENIIFRSKFLKH